MRRAATRSHSAKSALLLREPGDAGEHVERPRLHLLGAAVQVEGPGAVAEVALGDPRRQQQQRAADAHVRLAASLLHQREQALDQLFQPPGRARQLGERFVQRQVLGRGFDGAQLRLEGRIQLALRAQAGGHLRGDLRLRGCAGGAREPLLEQPGELVVRARGQQRPLQPRRLLRVLDRRRQGGVEELVRLARPFALAREAVEAQQNLRQRQPGAGRSSGWAEASSRVCTSRVR